MRAFARLLILLTVIGLAFVPSIAFADSSSSKKYGVDQVFFGSGGELDACSASGNYCSKQSAGEVTVGDTSGGGYDAQAGFNTTDEPLLEVAVNGNVDLGELSLSTTGKGSAQFQVRTYQSSGYALYLVGSAPKIKNHTLAGMGAGTLSTPGTEQFGVSLADTPPVQVPDDGFSFGHAITPYDQPAAYSWVGDDSGREVAASDSSTGQTNYTATMVANISPVTPAGRYTTSLGVVVVPIF